MAAVCFVAVCSHKFSFMSRRFGGKMKIGRFSVRPTFVVAGLLAVALGVWAAPAVIHEQRLLQARRLLDTHNAKRALELLQTVEKHANCKKTQFLLARANRRLGRLDDVRKHLNAAEEMGYSPAAIELEKWLTQAQSGHVSSVLPQLREYLATSNTDVQEVCEALVNGYLRNYRFEEAAHWLEAWEGDFPQEAQPHFCRGALWQHFDRLPDALKEFRRAVELEPGRTDVRLELGRVLAGLHQYDRAILQLQRCLEDDPQNSDVLAALAGCFLLQGELERPRKIYQQLLTRNPKDFSALWGLGQLALSDGNCQEAIDWLEKALNQQPRNQSVHHTLATALQACGRPEEAKVHHAFVEEATQALARVRLLVEQVQKQPDSLEPRYEIGVTLLQYASASDGIAWLYSALEIDPQHTKTHQALAEYYQQHGNPKLAERHARLAAGSPVPASND